MARTKTNLKKEVPYAKVARLIQEELASIWIHQGNRKLAELARDAGLSYATVKNNLHCKVGRPQINTILGLNKALNGEFHIIGDKVTFGRDGRTRAYRDKSVKELTTQTRGRKPNRYSKGTRRTVRKIIEAAAA